MKTRDQRQETEDFFSKSMQNSFFYFLGLLSLVSCLMSSPAFAGEDWLEGANGYEQGLEQAKVSGKPMIVMFYTDWCGYCRKLQKNVLDKPEVQKALSNFMKVRINPEKGDKENRLAEEHGVQGYPTVFLKRLNSNQPPAEMGSAIRNSATFIAAAKKFKNQNS